MATTDETVIVNPGVVDAMEQAVSGPLFRIDGLESTGPRFSLGSASISTVFDDELTSPEATPLSSCIPFLSSFLVPPKTVCVHFRAYAE